MKDDDREEEEFLSYQTQNRKKKYENKFQFHFGVNVFIILGELFCYGNALYISFMVIIYYMAV